MSVLARVGIVELAVAALSGWVMVVTVARPDMLTRLGVRHLNRVRQAHIDLILMGVLLTAVGAAAGAVPGWIAVLLIIGATLQPVMFLPLAVDAAIQERGLYRAANGVVFACTSIGWTALAVETLMR
ncbi:hypothetical protein [Mycolicibacterium arseniciresistens]|uniref:Uncharacterized protein n=1 Tax=Mycolicibacterium arseniciresistens TaxID=3062257 RepID=A0ABT8UJL2_9MYCO|nr:hypothetical protein [Mycolicibacterium arseniciresistens]MDO3637970.1 hypothetical protein [Mycolicibacterium arseniciresistens]